MNTPSKEEIEEMNMAMTLICNAVGPHLAQAIKEGVTGALLQLDKINQYRAASNTINQMPPHEYMERMVWMHAYASAQIKDHPWIYADNAVTRFNNRFPK